MNIMPEDLQASDIYKQIALINGLSDQQLQAATQNPKYGWMAGVVAAHRAEDRVPNPPMPQGTVIDQKLAQLQQMQGGIPAGMGNQQAMMQANPMTMGIAAAPENIPGAATGGIIALAHGGEVRGFPVGGQTNLDQRYITGRTPAGHRGRALYESSDAYQELLRQYQEATSAAERQVIQNKIDHLARTSMSGGQSPARRMPPPEQGVYGAQPSPTVEGKVVYPAQGMTAEEATAEAERLKKQGQMEALARSAYDKKAAPGAYHVSDFGDPTEMERLTPNTKGADYSNLEAGFPPQENAYPREQAKVWPTQTMKAKTAKIQEETAKLQAEKDAQTPKGKKGKKGKTAAPEAAAPTPEAPPAAPTPEAPQPEQPTLGKTREQAMAEFEASQQAAPAEVVGPPKPGLGTRVSQNLDAAKTAGVKALSGNTGAFLKGAGQAGTAFDVANAADVFMDPSMSTGEKAKATTQLSGRLGGAAVGAGLGLYGGPLAPVTVPVGAGVGYFLGGKGADYLSDRAGLPAGDPTEYSYGPWAQFKQTVSDKLAGRGYLEDEDRAITREQWEARRTANAPYHAKDPYFNAEKMGQKQNTSTPPAHDTAHGDAPGQVKADPNAPGHKPVPKAQPHPESTTPAAQATPTAQPTTPAGGMTVSAPGGITNAGARATTPPGGSAGIPTLDNELAYYKHVLGDTAYHAPEALNAQWEKQKEDLARDKWGLAAVRGIAGMISAPTEHWGKALGIGLGEAASQYAAGARQEEDLAEKSMARMEADARADYDFNQQAGKLHLAERAAKARDDADLRRAMAVANAGYNTAMAKLENKYELGASLTMKDALAQASKDWNAAVLQDPRLQDADSTAWINKRANELLRYGVSGTPQTQGGPATGARYIFDPNMGVRTAG